MESSRSNPPDGAMLYSERLLGLNAECPVCSGAEQSTGWLLQRENSSRWYVDLKCTECGSRGGTWRSEWLPLIEEVLKAEREI